jgi:hypothetical protein
MIPNFILNSPFKKITYLIGVFILIFGFCLGTINVTAQSGNKGLIISPIINDMDVEKGQRYSYNLDLYNDTPDYKYNIDIMKQTFVPSQSDGVPELADFKPSNNYSNWLSFDQNDFTVESGKKHTVIVNLDIPAEATPGGYYFALVFSDNPDGQNDLGAGVRIKQRIAALLFVNVKGQVEKSVKFTNIETNQKIYDPIFDAVSLKYTIKVEGGTYLKPSGNVFLNNGSKAGEDLFVLNPSEKIILPNSSRTFTISSKSNFEIPVLSTQVQAQENIKKIEATNENQINWSKPIFGNQKIEARVIYVDSDGKIAQQSIATDVFYWPWKTALMVVVIALILYYAWYKLKNFQKISKTAQAT